MANLQGIKAHGRLLPHDVVVHKVQNKSSRHGARIELIVLHDTEGHNRKGISDLAGLGNFFDIASVEASSHVATDADGNSARFVDDVDKAWHVAFYNPPSLGIEQLGFAVTQHWADAELLETARWIAKWHRDHGVPIRKGAVSLDGRILRSGVVLHSQLGNLGGGHHDPGTHYPFDEVLRVARGFQHLYERQHNG